jgi:hypothetical protein
MTIRHLLPAVLAAFVAFAVAPAWATDSHDYARDEYAIIRDGLSPDKRTSLASHADPDAEASVDGNNFHVWLMAEPSHRKIVALDDIGSHNNLDTGPNAYHAAWSADSRHVAVSFRSDRHVLQLNLYRIANRRPRLVFGPSLFKDVSSRDVGSRDNLRESGSAIEWRGTTRFVLSEHYLFLTNDPGFVRSLGAYGHRTDNADDGRIFVEFSAEADCVLMPGNRYRVVDLRVGKFRGE